MNLNEYRDAVRAVPCPVDYCQANTAGQSCTEPMSTYHETLDRVHDARALQWHYLVIVRQLDRILRSLSIAPAGVTAEARRMLTALIQEARS